MKRIWIALVALAAVLAACQATPTKGFTSSEGKFSVNMPSTPTEQVQKANSITLHNFVLSQNEVAYIVSYVDYPSGIVRPGMEEKLLDVARDSGVANSKGKLAKERHIKLHGKYPGREILVLVSGGKIAVKNRMYLVGNRLYQVVASAAQEKINTPEIDTYLDSFQLTGN